MNKNPNNPVNDYDDDEVITASSDEKEFDFNQAYAGAGGVPVQNVGVESVQDYDGRSAVGQRKKFGSGNNVLVWLLGIMAVVVGGWMIYKASNFDFSKSSSASTEMGEGEEAKEKDFRGGSGDRNFAEDFKRREGDQYQEQLIQDAEANGDQPIQAEQIDLNASNGNQPVIQDDGSNLNANASAQNNSAPPAPTEKPLTPAQEKMNRMLASSFNSGSGGTTGGFGGASSSNGGGSLAGGDDEERKPSKLESSMASVAFTGATAGKMKNRDLTIDKGTFIDCVMTTKFNSQLAGLMTCEVTRNIYSASGRVVLIDRGSKVTGQYQGGIQQGQTRVFVVWDRVVTPKGVAINIDSPASSELGESGLTGRVNNHFWKRFGGAMLVSLIDGVGDGLGKSLGASAGKSLDKALGNETGTTIIDMGGSNGSSGSTDVASKIIEQTINIPPTIVKHQGDKVTVFVSRDLDFSKVYKLH